jgi:hypothetical protein
MSTTSEWGRCRPPQRVGPPAATGGLVRKYRCTETGHPRCVARTQGGRNIRRYRPDRGRRHAPSGTARMHRYLRRGPSAGRGQAPPALPRRVRQLHAFRDQVELMELAGPGRRAWAGAGGRGRRRGRGGTPIHPATSHTRPSGRSVGCCRCTRTGTSRGTLGSRRVGCFRVDRRAVGPHSLQRESSRSTPTPGTRLLAIRSSRGEL